MKFIKQKAKVVVKKPSKQNNIVVSHESSISIANLIKSYRLFKKNNYIHIDPKYYPPYILNKDNRDRFSSKKLWSDENLKKLNEATVHNMIFKRYLENNIIDNGKVYFEDIGLKAIEEDSHNRVDDIQQDYVNIYNNYILKTFRGKLLKDIRVSDLKAWKQNLLTKKKLSRSRYLKYHRCMNFIFKYAYMNEYLDKNLMELVDVKSKLFSKSSNSQKKYYSSDEVKLILANATGWFKSYLVTLFYTGMRTGESLALKWSDVDFENDRIHIQRSIRHGKLRETTKTGTDNIIDMSKPVKEALLELKSYTKSREWIFPNLDKMYPYYQPSTLSKKFKKLVESLGIDFKVLYSTRSSYASVMAEKNIPITYIQKQLNHKKLSTTMDYYVKNGFVNNNKRDKRVDELFA